jgi:3',5'-cyclic-AMP phosphodiesterase
VRDSVFRLSRRWLWRNARDAATFHLRTSVPRGTIGVVTLYGRSPTRANEHIPLWAVYPQWGWGTDDAERALAFVKRFGSVTVLNGHIHQVMQKVEGNITFHTARGTAFPLPTPGSAPKPLPVVVEATQLKKMLGLTSVNYTETNHALAVVDSTLG